MGKTTAKMDLMNMTAEMMVLQRLQRPPQPMMRVSRDSPWKALVKHLYQAGVTIRKMGDASNLNMEDAEATTTDLELTKNAPIVVKPQVQQRLQQCHQQRYQPLQPQQLQQLQPPQPRFHVKSMLVNLSQIKSLQRCQKIAHAPRSSTKAIGWLVKQVTTIQRCLMSLP